MNASGLPLMICRFAEESGGGIRAMEVDVTSYKHTHTRSTQIRACLLRGIDGGDRDISSQAVVVLEKTK